jgi:hypothetical protein
MIATRMDNPPNPKLTLFLWISGFSDPLVQAGISYSSSDHQPRTPAG